MSKHFKKPSSIKEATLKTVRILLTVFSAALITLIVFFIVKDGWDNFIAWFNGKWFCMFAVFAIFAATLVFWLLRVIQLIRKATEENE